ncbi:hypothetical protein V1523DRAFT_408606 [Lipomyces doorenjongii]
MNILGLCVERVQQTNNDSYVMMKMDTLGTNILTFDNILDTQDCTAAVAAQGLMHVLTLAGAGVLSVHQRLSYGPIDVRLAPNVG